MRKNICLVAVSPTTQLPLLRLTALQLALLPLRELLLASYSVHDLPLGPGDPHQAVERGTKVLIVHLIDLTEVLWVRIDVVGDLEDMG